MEGRHIQHMNPPRGSYESLAYSQLQSNTLTGIIARQDTPGSADWRLQDLVWRDLTSFHDQVWPRLDSCAWRH